MTVRTAAGRDAVLRRAVRLVGVSLGYFLVLLDTTVLTVALPDLRRSLGGPVAGQQWAVAGYTVVFAALLLGAGAVADRYGARRVFAAGVAAFGVLSLASAAAPTLWVLVVLRALLGAAGAACLPASLALVARLYPVAAERARALGAWAAITGVALAAGPVAGGALVSLAGWRAVFLVNVPVAALALLLTAGRTLAAPRGTGRVDWGSQLLAAAFLGLVTAAVIGAGAFSLPTGAAALLALALLVRRQRRAPHPLVPTALLRVPAARSALLSGAAVNFALSGTLFVVTLVLQDRYGWGPLAAGLAFLPLTLPTAFNPLVTGRLVARYGPRRPVLAGLGLLTAGALLLAAAPGYAVLAVGLAVTGLGVSFALPALVTATVAAAPDGLAGTASGLLNAVRQVGATVGVAAMGAVVAPGLAAVPVALLLSAAVVAAALAGTARA
ncbi:MFS transporter [Actinocatenispora rupis]|uniref:MFS transporter n=1 Tax=Actinocatenispora rupis TaxID=519421 RepID=A0A8J3J488_9ACTN|nr:MFS transporter [Actinocatenispora rupis]GID11672.1 MFS transporter [Actinocatenispora rupis]